MSDAPKLGHASLLARLIFIGEPHDIGPVQNLSVSSVTIAPPEWRGVAAVNSSDVELLLDFAQRALIAGPSERQVRWPIVPLTEDSIRLLIAERLKAIHLIRQRCPTTGDTHQGSPDLSA
jgi:hypothetical protein